MISREQLERWKALADALPAWKRTDDGGLVGPPQEFGPPLSDEELCEMFEIGTVTAFAREAVPILLAEIEEQAKEIERLRAALRQASDDICRGVSDHVCSVSHPTARNRWCASCIARAALKEGT